MTSLTFELGYSPRYAFVDAIFSFSSLSEKVIRANQDSWKARALLKFIFDKKKITVNGTAITIKMDSLDKEFFKAIKEVPNSHYGILRKITEKLDDKLWDRKKALNELKTYVTYFKILRK